MSQFAIKRPNAPHIDAFSHQTSKETVISGKKTNTMSLVIQFVLLFAIIERNTAISLDSKCCCRICWNFLIFVGSISKLCWFSRDWFGLLFGSRGILWIFSQCLVIFFSIFAFLFDIRVFIRFSCLHSISVEFFNISSILSVYIE